MVRIIFFTGIIAVLTSDIFVSGEEIEISFKNFTYSDEDHVDLEINLLPDSEVKALITNVPKSIDYFIFQVHSFMHNVILSYDSKLLLRNHVNGTNIGLYSNTSHPLIFYIKNPNAVNVSCMIAAVPYTYESPVPGGCNMEFPTNIAPYLNVQTTDAMIAVDGPPASLSTHCDMNIISYVMFYKFLLPNDFSINAYFESIRSMLTYPRILKSSYLAPQPIAGPILRRTFTRYSGIGTVYSLIALNKFGNVAVYTPTFLFPFEDLDGCDSLSVAVKLELATVALMGLFLCFAGHRYFIGELFFLGAIGGFLLSFMLLFHETTSSADLLLMCNGIGFICGVVWTSIWWCVNSPILSVGLSFVLHGFLVSSMSFFIMSLFFDLTIFEFNVNYWLTFFVSTILFVLIATNYPVRYNIFSCAAIGSYGLILPFDFYFGTSLKYIVGNVIRRATIEGFNLAITKPPLQLADLVLALMWFVITLLGISCQRKLSARRPPFPPVCLLLREHVLEATPVLTSASFPSYS